MSSVQANMDDVTGAPVAGPCLIPLRTYPVDIRNDELWIDL